MRAVTTVGVISMVALIAACGGARSRHDAAGGSKILVREFETSGAQVTAYERATNGFGLEFAQALVKHLNESGFDADAVPRGAAVPKDVTLVQGDVVKIDGGNRALRYTVGFGAGATEFGVRGKVVGKSGEMVGQFTTSRRSGVGAFGGDTESLMHRCVEAVADDVADMVASGKYASK